MADSDVHVIAEVVAQPGNEAKVRDGFTAFARTVPSEPGCKSYKLLESATQPGHFMTAEVWADQASIDAHMQTPELGALIAALSPLLAKPPIITALRALT